jgi:hypothetical protein
MVDELTDHDLAMETAADLALTSSIRRKRPAVVAVHWGRLMVWILEFSRVNHYKEDWCETMERYKTGWYPLSNRTTEALPRGLSVKQINLTLRIRGSFAETWWTAALASLGV